MEEAALVASREDDMPPFGKLSIDLILWISDYLLVESVFALALTTKPLYYSQALQNLWKPSVGIDRRRYAQLIAKYTSDQIYCAFCKRLHPRRTTPKITKDWSSFYPCAPELLRALRRKAISEIRNDWPSLSLHPLNPPSHAWLHLDPWDYHLQFEDVNKVMIRHLWGAPYGDDLKSLAVETDWQALTYNHARKNPGGYMETRARYLVKLTVKPEIIEDKLVLHTVQRIWYDRDLWDNCRRADLCYPLLSCQHARGPGHAPSNRDPRLLHRKILQIIRSCVPWQQRSGKAMVHLPFGACIKCMSIHSSVLWNHGAAGVELGLYTWTDLGMCDYDLSPEWTSATDHDWTLYHDRRDFFDRTSAFMYAFELLDQITEAHSEIRHPSFERAKHDFAIRNQQDLLKDRSRVSRFVDRSRRAVKHLFGQKKS